PWATPSPVGRLGIPGWDRLPPATIPPNPAGPYRQAANHAARTPHEHRRTGAADMTIANGAAQELSGTTALVTGASRGFGRGIAAALSKASAQVVGVARDRARLEELRAQLGAPSATCPILAWRTPTQSSRGGRPDRGAARPQQPVHLPQQLNG